MIAIFKKSFFTNKKYIAIIWIVIAIISAIKQFSIHSLNNYLIFKNVFWHTIHQTSLYTEYPAEYFDHNHYGPVFSLFIAPFALMPDGLGVIFWNAFNAMLLVWAISKLPLQSNKINLILWIAVNEFVTANLGFQFNPIMTALIILSYVYIVTEKDFWAAFCIVLGTFIKLYGVVGLAFFFFSKNKPKFIGALVVWSMILFVLPMFISSPEFILNSYKEWFERLIVKNAENASLNSMQDISAMGIFRRVLQMPNVSNLPFLAVGLMLFGLPYLRIKLYSNEKFKLLLLASVLIFTVIFSSGSESPTYIIAFLGVAIWFVIQENPISIVNWVLFIFAIVVTSLSPTDLMPKYLQNNVIEPYALKALPCVLIWFKIIYEMMTLKDVNANLIELK